MSTATDTWWRQRPRSRRIGTALETWRTLLSLPAMFAIPGSDFAPSCATTSSNTGS